MAPGGLRPPLLALAVLAPVFGLPAAVAEQLSRFLRTYVLVLMLAVGKMQKARLIAALPAARGFGVRGRRVVGPRPYPLAVAPKPDGTPDDTRTLSPCESVLTLVPFGADDASPAEPAAAAEPPSPVETLFTEATPSAPVLDAGKPVPQLSDRDRRILVAEAEDRVRAFAIAERRRLEGDPRWRVLSVDPEHRLTFDDLRSLAAEDQLLMEFGLWEAVPEFDDWDRDTLDRRAFGSMCDDAAVIIERRKREQDPRMTWWAVPAGLAEELANEDFILDHTGMGDPWAPANREPVYRTGEPQPDPEAAAIRGHFESRSGRRGRPIEAVKAKLGRAKAKVQGWARGLRRN
ncbi:hypothetical protein DFJ74DRAFT_679200 [Hyaloraphidium curvatum]|nr:hypothetical protein DFJ74DRAFT_679200 [Hyaloraphidium curvatum]